MGRKLFITLVLVCFTLAVFSQQKDSVKVRLNHYTLTVGGGWTHFINNLEYGDKNIQNNFAGVSFKFYWEPEYRVSLGLESGYYHLFKVKYQAKDNSTAEINRTVVPLLLLVRMRVVDNFYLGAGIGLAFINNKASSGGKELITKTTSMSNYEVSGAYIYPLNKYFLVGGECKVFRFANLNDWMYSIQATFAVKF